MNINFLATVFDPKRNSFAILCGLIGGMIPNKKSNIPHPLLGFIFAILFTKIVFGDYDSNYQWTYSDFLFVIIIGGLGTLSAILSNLILNLFPLKH